MAANKIEFTIKKIKNLKIQGSSRVRKAIVDAMEYGAENSTAKTPIAFGREMEKNAHALLTARPTEPEARTAVRIILKAASHQAQTIADARENVLRTIKNYERDRENAMKTIAEYGANLIPKNSVVFTHCHSHTVEEILKKAGKKIDYVISTETRPLFQGRITARALTNAGIEVTQIVDSAAACFMHKADLLITGCDAVLIDGSIVNKIGTRLISLAAGKEDVPHYVATSSHCFEPLSYFGFPEEIEERPASEIWEKKLKGLTIKNPAFDITQAHFVKEIITEKGVFAPQAFAMLMHNELGLEHSKKEFMSLLRLWKKD
ncbi:MAG: ribose 1,5-bisphosphate isomerase [Candidatus Diapherotrites archaeon]|nr:ribose 1,5-bisphosphate isomerase [Candidatus Diapherotrites archaeon]